MKNILFLAVIVTFAMSFPLSLLSQPGNNYLPDSTISSAWNGNKWEPVSLETNKYDGKGKQIESSILSSKNNMWIIMRKSFYTYDSSGNLTEKLSKYFSSGDEEKEYSKILYTYNSKNKKISYEPLRMDTKTSQWKKFEKREYVYNDSGKSFEELAYLWKNGKWELNFKVLTVGDKSHKEVIYKKFLNNRFTNHYGVTSSNDSSNGKPINITYMSMDIYEKKSIKHPGFTGEMIVETYDSTGKPVENKSIKIVNDSIFGCCRTLFKYDASGNPIEELMQDSVGNKWIDTYLTKREFDSVGNVIREVEQSSMNNTWINESEIRYKYIKVDIK